MWMMSAMLELDDLTLRLEQTPVVRSLSLTLKEGDIGCLVGPSGCGKTTLLRAIAGFTPLAGGRVLLDGHTVARPGRQLQPEKRRVGMVFQDVALFPHLSVSENIGFGLRHWDASKRRHRVDSLLRRLGLPDMGERMPHQLSGGQQQRVALARAMAPGPRLLLLDEPFSALDAELREQIARDVRQVLKAEGVTALLVTHDQNEAFATADQLGVMRAGVLHQWDTPFRIYHEPATRFVADFIGRGVLLPGQVTESGQVKTVLAELKGRLPDTVKNGDEVDVLVRPDDLIHDDSSPMKGKVLDRSFRGAYTLYTLELEDGARLPCIAPSHHSHEKGEMIGVRMEMDHLVVFPRDADKEKVTHQLNT
jgi:iron(III) transport system ATP-binding protein